MRPILHINAGVGWSATKPLCYTLENCGYAHRGATTETNLLYYIFERKYKPEHAAYYWANDHSHRGMDFVKEKTTLNDYIKYIKSHIKPSHKGVSDFSNSNGDLPAYFLKEISPVLQKYFDVTVTMIFRNPVRRSYSQCSNWFKHLTDNENAPYTWKNRDPEKAEKWRKIGEEHDSISFWKTQISEPSHLCPNYVSIYKNWSSAFPKVMPLVMEEMWGDARARNNFCWFLGQGIGSMHPNVYYPEMGTRRPEISGLGDQWRSDMQDLTQEDLVVGREKLDWLYQAWYNEFREIPKSWII